MKDLAVVEDAAPAVAILHPLRAQILAAVSTPGSATSVAHRLGLPRQKVNYHLRTLEGLGLVEPVEERAWGGLTERLFLASASSYVISPSALGHLSSSVSLRGDRLSATYLISLAARSLREVGSMLKRAEKEDKRLATLAVDVDIHFGSPQQRAAFADELGDVVRSLASRYHRPGSTGSRSHRLVVLAYPEPATQSAQENQ